MLKTAMVFLKSSGKDWQLAAIPKRDLQALYLCGTYCQTTILGSPSCVTPREPTIYDWKYNLSLGIFCSFRVFRLHSSQWSDQSSRDQGINCFSYTSLPWLCTRKKGEGVRHKVDVDKVARTQAR